MSRVLREDHRHSAWVHAMLITPACEVLVSLESVGHHWSVEVEAVVGVALSDKVLSEYILELCVLYALVDVVQDGCSWLAHVDAADGIDCMLHFVEDVESVVIYRGKIQAEETCDSIIVVCSSLQCNETADSVAADSGSRDPVVVHEPEKVISKVFIFKAIIVVGVAKVTRIDNPNISLLQYLGNLLLRCFVCQRRRESSFQQNQRHL